MTVLQYAGDRALALQATHQRLWWARHKKLELIRLDRSGTIVDEDYGESRNWHFDHPAQLPMTVQINPPRKLLKRWGLEDEDVVVFGIGTVVLDDMGILEESDSFLIGDLVRFRGDLYQIEQQNSPGESFFVNTFVPFYFECPATLFREGDLGPGAD